MLGSEHDIEVGRVPDQQASELQVASWVRVGLEHTELGKIMFGGEEGSQASECLPVCQFA